jgi:hypothetical protein
MNHERKLALTAIVHEQTKTDIFNFALLKLMYAFYCLKSIFLKKYEDSFNIVCLTVCFWF